MADHFLIRFAVKVKVNGIVVPTSKHLHEFMAPTIVGEDYPEGIFRHGKLRLPQQVTSPVRRCRDDAS